MTTLDPHPLTLPHTEDLCDEACRFCTQCYRRDGVERCRLTCEHAEEETDD